MATLDDLIARRDALLKIRAGGVRQVQDGDSTIIYRSDAEISAAIADLNRQISQASGTGCASTIYVSSSKGV